jgi:hypothetical protein
VAALMARLEDSSESVATAAAAALAPLVAARAAPGPLAADILAALERARTGRSPEYRALVAGASAAAAAAAS